MNVKMLLINKKLFVLAIGKNESHGEEIRRLKAIGFTEKDMFNTYHIVECDSLARTMEWKHFLEGNSGQIIIGDDEMTYMAEVFEAYKEAMEMDVMEAQTG